MEFETKILSKGIQEMLYNSDKTVGTAESCTGGLIAEAHHLRARCQQLLQGRCGELHQRGKREPSGGEPRASGGEDSLLRGSGKRDGAWCHQGLEC